MVASVTAWIEMVMLTQWVYPLVGSLIFLDCFFPVLPSEIPLNMVGTRTSPLCSSSHWWQPFWAIISVSFWEPA